MSARRLRQAPVLRDSHVLVVDDSRAIHDQVHEALSRAGCEAVDHAASAREALVFYDAKRPDLVLVDMLMPGVDGADLCRELLSRHPRARLVLLTALPPAHDKVVDALSQGARAVVHKPVAAQALVAALQEAVAT